MVVATPHVRPDFLTDVGDLPDRVRQVEARLREERVPLRVACGAELGHEMLGRLGQADLETVALGPPDGRWLLLETPFEGIDERVHEASDELRDRGFAVVLAHPERSAGAIDGKGPGVGLQLELELGSVLQVNASSLTGAHGSDARAAALTLLREGVVEAVASDAHSPVRGPALERGLRAAIDHGIPEAVVRRPTDFRPVRLMSRGLAARLPAVTA